MASGGGEGAGEGERERERVVCEGSARDQRFANTPAARTDSRSPIVALVNVVAILTTVLVAGRLRW